MNQRVIVLALLVAVFLASVVLAGYYVFGGPHVHTVRALLFGGLAVLSLVATFFSRNLGRA